MYTGIFILILFHKSVNKLLPLLLSLKFNHYVLLLSLLIIIYYFILNRTCSWTWIVQSKSILHQQKAMCSSLHNLQISQRNWHHSKLHFLIITLGYFMENKEGNSIVLNTFWFSSNYPRRYRSLLFVCAWRRNFRLL